MSVRVIRHSRAYCSFFQGAFGEVRLVREKASGEVFAMKKLRKCEMVHPAKYRHSHDAITE